MKYVNVEQRQRWEDNHRVTQPGNTQKYWLAKHVEIRQSKLEEKIEKYRNEGRRLNKKMRSYLRQKKSCM